ncbi:MAG: dihydrolipoyl dehydrogenase [Planctomycetota bacterium]|nr:MAG: dihydrolipoyl dehydrogenase [Planctomycetota bacterium]
MSEIRTDAVVVGAGPAGYVCAIRLAQYGRRVVVVEQAELGGTCLNQGCIPSKALIAAGHFLDQVDHAQAMGFTVARPELDLGKLVAWKDSIVQRLTGGIGMLFKKRKIELVRGRARLAAPNRVAVETADGPVEIAARDVVLATGSEPAPIPGFEFGERVWSSTEALSPTEVPGRLLVIGGGVIGLELGMFYARVGAEVRVVEYMDQILPGIDPELVKVVARKAKKAGIKIHTSAAAQGWSEADGALEVRVEEKGKEQVFAADRILLTVGRRPVTRGLGLEEVGVKVDERGFVPVDAQRQTNVPHVYAIGDIGHGPMLAHKGSAEGLAAAAAIAGRPGAAYDPKVVPAVIFTDPEIACVGLSEAEAREQGREVKVGRFNFGANGRALSLQQTDGLVKVVADAADDTVLGLHMVGPNVTDMIAEGAVAIEGGLTAEDLALTIHPHPTLAETIMEAAEDVHGLAVHAAR